jgi:hypothetical protein
MGKYVDGFILPLPKRNVEAYRRFGDVRDFVSGVERGTPLWPTKVHDQEHPDVTADCDDRKFTSSV